MKRLLYILLTMQINFSCLSSRYSEHTYLKMDPNQFIEVKGSSGYGKLDKYGTGNGMTYSQKYAFLAALNNFS